MTSVNFHQPGFVQLLCSQSIFGRNIMTIWNNLDSGQTVRTYKDAGSQWMLSEGQSYPNLTRSIINTKYHCFAAVNIFKNPYVILTFTILWANSTDENLIIFSLFLSQEMGCPISCKLSPLRGQFAWNVKAEETICMKCQRSFSGKN